MQALEQKYLTAITENYPNTTPYPISLFFTFGLSMILTARNKEAWATWLDARIRAVWRLASDHPDALRTYAFLNAVKDKTSPLQYCLNYRNRTFYDMFVKLGCQETFPMFFPTIPNELPEVISIADYARREGIWETARHI